MISAKLAAESPGATLEELRKQTEETLIKALYFDRFIFVPFLELKLPVFWYEYPVQYLINLLRKMQM
jgi:hypothetical protein